MSLSSQVRDSPGGTTSGAVAKDPRPAPMAPSIPAASDGWTPVCPLDRLQPERGVCALVAGEPVAVFRTHDDRLFALHNLDPFSGASVLSRGIVGDLQGTPVVASPLYKQHFALDSGVSVEDDSIVVAPYDIRVHNGTIEVRRRS